VCAVDIMKNILLVFFAVMIILVVSVFLYFNSAVDGFGVQSDTDQYVPSTFVDGNEYFELVTDTEKGFFEVIISSHGEALAKNSKSIKSTETRANTAVIPVEKAILLLNKVKKFSEKTVECLTGEKELWVYTKGEVKKTCAPENDLILVEEHNSLLNESKELIEQYLVPEKDIFYVHLIKVERGVTAKVYHLFSYGLLMYNEYNIPNDKIVGASLSTVPFERINELKAMVTPNIFETGQDKCDFLTRDGSYKYLEMQFEDKFIWYLYCNNGENDMTAFFDALLKTMEDFK
jgi:hypothetical protein